MKFTLCGAFSRKNAVPERFWAIFVLVTEEVVAVEPSENSQWSNSYPEWAVALQVATGRQLLGRCYGSLSLDDDWEATEAVRLYSVPVKEAIPLISA